MRLGTHHTSVRLCPLTPDRCDIISTLFLDGETASRTLFRGSRLTAPPPRSLDDVWAGVHEYYAIELQGDGTQIGVVSSYAADFRSGHVRVMGMTLERWHRTGLGLIGIGGHVHRLLTREPFRKVYFDVPEYNVPTMRRLAGALFKLEASLPDSFFLDGRLWDRQLYIVSREAYARSEVRDFLATVPCGEHEGPGGARATVLG